MRALLKLSQGDMRRALNILQSCASAFDKVTADSVYATTGAPLPSDVEQIVTWLLNEPFATAFHRTSQSRAGWRACGYLTNRVNWVEFRVAVRVAVAGILQLKTTKGIALADLLQEIHHFVVLVCSCPSTTRLFRLQHGADC